MRPETFAEGSAEMNRYSQLDIAGYEEVVRCDNEDVGFSSWIAIHNSNRGPALGGCRLWNYASADDALFDVLRLSRGMTYKNSLAQLPLGGGKCVVRTDLGMVDREALFEAVGGFVDTFEGRYITAEDVNSTLEDMAIVKRCTNHVVTVGASGNPSPFTAFGVYCAIRAGVLQSLGQTSLKGLRVSIQGVGETGGRLAKILASDGCILTVADIDQDNLRRLNNHIQMRVVSTDAIHRLPSDIFCPCALGGILNSASIPELNCSIVAGSANNQLLDRSDGELLHRRGVVYIPDYAANAGGVINISCEIDREYNEDLAWEKTALIGETVAEILHRSASTNTPTSWVADVMAEELFKLEVLA